MQISHDTFTRDSLVRTNYYNEHKTCSWCGGARQTSAGRQYLYDYAIESANYRQTLIDGHFCCIGCMRAYHGN